MEMRCTLGRILLLLRDRCTFEVEGACAADAHARLVDHHVELAAALRDLHGVAAILRARSACEFELYVLSS